MEYALKLASQAVFLIALGYLLYVMVANQDVFSMLALVSMILALAAMESK